MMGMWLTPRSCTRDIVAAAVASSDENKMATRRARSTPWLTCRRSTKSSPRKAFLVARGPKTGLKRSAGRSTGCSMWEMILYKHMLTVGTRCAMTIFFFLSRGYDGNGILNEQTAFLYADSGVENALWNLLRSFRMKEDLIWIISLSTLSYSVMKNWRI